MQPLFSFLFFFFFTQYDTELDAQSLNAGQQILEKLIGGMCIGKRRCMYSSARGHRCSREATVYAGICVRTLEKYEDTYIFFVLNIYIGELVALVNNAGYICVFILEYMYTQAMYLSSYYSVCRRRLYM